MRGALFTALQRHLGNDRIVIVDSLNYIKGFRYQMYCAAREAKVRVCTVRDRRRTLSQFCLTEREVGLCDRAARTMPRMERIPEGRARVHA